MLNLSDIRKKARKGKRGDNKASDGVGLPPGELQDLVAEAVVEETVTVEPVEPVEPESVSGLVPEMSAEELQELQALERAAAAEEAALAEPELSELELTEVELSELQALEENVAVEEAAVEPPAAEPQPAPPIDPVPMPVPDAVTEPEPEPESTHHDDPLEALFNFRGDVDFATEEAYFEGLVGEAVKDDEDLRQMLSFSLGDEEYMIDIRDVREIIKMREITDIPRAPYFILGVISLRGNIIPVFDLKKRLKLGAVESSPDVRIVVCQKGELIVGLMVERINQVVRLPLRSIESTPAILSGLDRDLVEGVGRYQGKMLILLDLPSVMDAELF